jgi:hypothetical protein
VSRLCQLWRISACFNEANDLLLDGVSKAKIDGGKAKLLEAPKIPII